MNVNEPLPLLGGLAPKSFMARHWQRKPLLIRQAIAGFLPSLNRADLVELAGNSEVESRLIVRVDSRACGQWRLRHGPFARRALPPFRQPGWTLLVQGVDLHDERVHALMNLFRFVPNARLDDVMVSYASDQGGVGPHFDSYDVFLLQAQGRRRWRVGRQRDLRLQSNMPLKILANFEPEMEFILDPGDMLYLPPRYAHEGVALGDCMTYSIGFRSPSRSELTTELLQRISDQTLDEGSADLYRDPKQEAVEHSGAIPLGLFDFAQSALAQVLLAPTSIQCALGEYLTEPKASVCFDAKCGPIGDGMLRLDRRSRMMYDDRFVFINGESFLAVGRDARHMRALADERVLAAAQVRQLGADARALVFEWVAAGWLYVE